jgi:hypothetical protein
MAEQFTTPDSLDKTVANFRTEFQIASDFCDPHFELAARHYALWRGRKPWQLDGTASKIMLNIAFGICQDRIPKLKKNILGGEDFVSLESLHPRYDSGREQAEAWLRNLLKDESQLNILSEIEPTLQSAVTMGTGYRMPFARKTKGGKWQVSSRDVDFFQILPAPVGGRINPMDCNHDDCLPYFFYVDWMTNEQIKALSAFPGYQKDQAEKCLASKINNVGDNTQYQELYSIIGGVNYGTGKNDWRTRMNDTERGKETGRRRVVHWFLRDKWIIIAQDSYRIYEGPSPLGEGLLPLTQWRLTNDFTNWFGIGSLEMVEDLIIAILMNFGYRLDHLGRVMFPTKWIRSDVMGGRPESDFSDRPFAIHEFPMSVQRITDAISYDRAPEITDQTFIEEDRLKVMLENVNGSPNYSEAMGKSHGIGNSATGAVSFINQVAGRLESESMLLEYGGLAQECRQLLILADKYINDEEFIRTPKSPNGTGWMSIDPDYLTDGYIVKTHGTKTTADQEQAFQRMLALYPMWNQDPMIDPYELRKSIADSSGVPNLTKVVVSPQPENTPMGGAPTGGAVAQPGGASAPQGLENRLRASRERSTPTASGRTVPANRAM